MKGFSDFLVVLTVLIEFRVHLIRFPLDFSTQNALKTVLGFSKMRYCKRLDTRLQFPMKYERLACVPSGQHKVFVERKPN